MTMNDFDDAILPEGFDPNADNFDFGIEGGEQPAAPTTEPTPAEPATETTDSQQASVLDALLNPQPTTAETQTPEAQAQQGQPAPADAPAPQTIKIRFNHEDREIGLDEAAVLAQKGLNYDKLNQRVQEFEATHAKSDQLAKQLGYKSTDEMIAAAAENFRSRQVRELVDAGNTEAVAQFLVDQRMAKAQAEASALANAEAQPQQPAAEPGRPQISPEREAELKEFVTNYPGITKLPDEVIAANRKGVRLLVAYERYLNKAARDELAVLKQNQAAAAKAPVNGAIGKASAPDAGVDDPFLKGFESAY